jgi:hypothetical protein
LYKDPCLSCIIGLGPVSPGTSFFLCTTGL